MSNNNTNNERSNNVTRRNNFSKKKPVKQPKVNPNEIKVPLFLSADLDDNLVDEILDVLSNTRFNKISIPLGTYRSLIDSNVDMDDNRISTIGYIRDYDAETSVFTVIIFNNFIDLIKKFDNPAVNLMMNIRNNNSLGSITKFNIVPEIDNKEEAKIDE